MSSSNHLGIRCEQTLPKPLRQARESKRTRVMTPDFWGGKRVFVTGHTGFKGSWLSLWLQQLGAEVTGYALAPPSQPNLFGLARVEEAMRAVEGDIGNLEHLQKVLSNVRPDVVFHLAAQSVVRLSYEDPLGTFKTNVLGSVHLMEAVRRTPSVRAVVMVTSDKCYRNREWVWGYRESDALGGRDPYSSSKGCAELAAASYRHAFFSSATSAEGAGVALATARAGNVIGGGDWKRDALVPDTLRALLEGTPLTLRNPHATRPWQFVLDPLRGYLMLAERLFENPSYADAWNFGPQGAVRTADWIAQRLHTLWGRPYRMQRMNGAQPHEDTLLQLDVSKAAAALQWEALLPVEQTLEWIVTWTQAYAAGEDMRRVCSAQIEAFMALEPARGTHGATTVLA